MDSEFGTGTTLKASTLLHKNEFFRLHEIPCLNSIEVDPPRHSRGIEMDFVEAGLLIPVHQLCDLLPEGVVDSERHVRPLRDAVADSSRWVEGVGVVLREVESLWFTAGNSFD